jgi:hypothetical protein
MIDHVAIYKNLCHEEMWTPFSKFRMDEKIYKSFQISDWEIRSLSEYDLKFILENFELAYEDEVDRRHYFVRRDSNG